MEKLKFLDYYNIYPVPSGYWYEPFKIYKNIKELDVSKFNILWLKEYPSYKKYAEKLVKLPKSERIILFGKFIKTFPEDIRKEIYKDFVGFRNYIFEYFFLQSTKKIFRINYDDIHFSDLSTNLIKERYTKKEYLNNVKFNFYDYVVSLEKGKGLYLISLSNNQVIEKYSNFFDYPVLKDLITALLISIVKKESLLNIQEKIINKLSLYTSNEKFKNSENKYIDERFNDDTPLSELKYFYYQKVFKTFYMFL